MHKGRWKDNYKVFCITEHLRLVWFTPNSPCREENWGFHRINGGGLRFISENKIWEIVW